MLRRPPGSPLFPYTTLFRSLLLNSPLQLNLARRARLARDFDVREEDERLDAARAGVVLAARSEEHTSELQSRRDLVCRLLLDKKKLRDPPVRVGLSREHTRE